MPMESTWSSCLCIALASSGAWAGETTVWYGGDADAASGAIFPGSTIGGLFSQKVYDDFDWNGSTVSSAFGHFAFLEGNTFETVASPNVVGIEYIIALDPTGGTLISGQTTDFAMTNVGGVPNFNADLWFIDVDIPDEALDAGTYFVSIAPIIELEPGDVTYTGFVIGTLGDNAVGTPVLNGNSAWFDGVADPYELSYDFSYGVRGIDGEVIPLPSAAALGGFGLLGLGTRRRR